MYWWSQYFGSTSANNQSKRSNSSSRNTNGSGIRVTSGENRNQIKEEEEEEEMWYELRDDNGELYYFNKFISFLKIDKYDFL